MPHKNALEWTVFAISALLIVVTAAWLTYAHFLADNRPPSIRIEAGAPGAAADGYAVPLEIHNDGDRTAEALQVEAELRAGGVVERSTVEIEFVPYRSSRRAWVTFTRRPEPGELHIRVLGYQEP